MTRVAVVGHEGVDEHEVGDALTDVVEGAGDDEAAVGVADEHDLVEVLVEHGVDDVEDVRRQADVRDR